MAISTFRTLPPICIHYRRKNTRVIYRLISAAISVVLSTLLLEVVAAQPRLVPNDYHHNAVPFDSVSLPEAWHFMQGKWAAERLTGIGRWPFVVIIDDGFFEHDDLARPITLGPTYDNTGASSKPSSSRGELHAASCQGYHGTATATILGGMRNNGPAFLPAWNVASVAGPWQGRSVGVALLPVRVTGGPAGFGCGNHLAMVAALQYAAGNRPEYHLSGTYPIRVVNISKQLVANNDFTVPPKADLETAFRTLASKAIVVLAAGNDRQYMVDKGWLASLGSVVTVGALNRTGTHYWNKKGGKQGTRRGPGVDIYAPGEDIVSGTAPDHLSDVLSGTSFAAPFISGVLAMMWNANECMSKEAHVRVLLATANEIMVGKSIIKRVNAYEAIKRAYELGDPNVMPPPQEADLWFPCRPRR